MGIDLLISLLQGTYSLAEAIQISSDNILVDLVIISSPFGLILIFIFSQGAATLVGTGGSYLFAYICLSASFELILKCLVPLRVECKCN